MKRLDGRVAVVTGAGSGIGRATAHALAARGCRVALVDVEPDGIEAVRAELPGGAERASVHVADVADAERMAALPAEVLGVHGAVHVLVNNAGVTTAGRFVDDTMDDLRWLVGINVWGVLHGCRGFLPVLLEQDEAHVVNVASMAAFVGLPHNAVYSMTKGAVRTFTEGLRGELASTPVGVTAVFPGAINTDIASRARGAEADRLRAMGEATLARRLLTQPDTVARRIVRAIERDRARAVVGPDAHVLDLLSRLLPGRTRLLGRALDRAT